jgi:hypothetical protein
MTPRGNTDNKLYVPDSSQMGDMAWREWKIEFDVPQVIRVEEKKKADAPICLDGDQCPDCEWANEQSITPCVNEAGAIMSWAKDAPTPTLVCERKDCSAAAACNDCQVAQLTVLSTNPAHLRTAWTCGACTFANDLASTACRLCSVSRAESKEKWASIVSEEVPESDPLPEGKLFFRSGLRSPTGSYCSYYIDVENTSSKPILITAMAVANMSSGAQVEIHCTAAGATWRSGLGNNSAWTRIGGGANGSNNSPTRWDVKESTTNEPLRMEAGEKRGFVFFSSNSSGVAFGNSSSAVERNDHLSITPGEYSSNSTRFSTSLSGQRQFCGDIEYTSAKKSKKTAPVTNWASVSLSATNESAGTLWTWNTNSTSLKRQTFPNSAEMNLYLAQHLRVLLRCTQQAEFRKTLIDENWASLLLDPFKAPSFRPNDLAHDQLLFRLTGNILPYVDPNQVDGSSFVDMLLNRIGAGVCPAKLLPEEKEEKDEKDSKEDSKEKEVKAEVVPVLGDTQKWASLLRAPTNSYYSYYFDVKAGDADIVIDAMFVSTMSASSTAVIYCMLFSF